jgi:hypothetical protein
MRLRDRQYPGVLVQGDSLYALFVDASELVDEAKRSGHRELELNAQALQGNLGDLLERYEQALKEHGITLPYQREARTAEPSD